VVICLERGADLHMPQLMPLPLTVSCFSQIQIGFTFLVPAHPLVPEKEPLNGCVCVCLCACHCHAFLMVDVTIIIVSFSAITLLAVLHKGHSTHKNLSNIYP